MAWAMVKDRELGGGAGFNTSAANSMYIILTMLRSRAFYFEMY